MAAAALNYPRPRPTEPFRILNQSGVQPATGTTLSHQTANGLPLPPAPSNLPLRPNVKADNEDANLMPFYDVLESILPPTSLQITNLTQRAQEQQLRFYLTERQVNQITISRYKNDSTNRVEYPMQVQLRCFKILPGPQTDVFPAGVSCRVNKQLPLLPPVIPTNKPNAEPQRPGRPINLTPMCCLSPYMPNLLHMGYNYDHTANYCIEINLVRALSPEDLIERIRTRGARPADFTRSMIREKLSPSDCELAVTELVASLMCPLGKMRIQLPLRAQDCSHVQCFDAYCYLAMNAKKPVWKCPFCDQTATYRQLYIDGYFQEILATSQSVGLDRLQFRPDGTWCDADAWEAASIHGNGDSSKTFADSASSKMGATAGAAPGGESASANSVVASNLVDLTISDDDDDEEGPMPPQPPPQPPQPQQLAPQRPQEPVVVINLDSSDEEN